MIPRRPPLDFTTAPLYWADNRAFAQIINAGSTSLPYIEPYLNRVMARASDAIEDPALKKDIALFRAQEGNHYRLHKQFNRLLSERYPGLAALEEALGRYYQDMLANRSLLFNAAYCEGFECLGLIHAEFFFEQIGDLTAGADSRVVDLWRWHLAEEFEHRTVCYDVHRALGGNYLTRLAGFLVALRHLSKYGMDVSAHLLEADRAAMSPEERQRSLAQAKAYNKRFQRFAMPRLLYILSPGYDPRTKREPRGVADVLARFAHTAPSGGAT